MKDVHNRVLLLVALMMVAVAARLLPHPPNFSPIGAIALFAGASFADRRLALVLPLAIMLISDLFIGLHQTLPVVYGCLALNVLLGQWAGNKLSVSRLLPAGLLGSVIFFVATNVAVWLNYGSPTWESLATYFAQAVPFFRYTLAGDMFYGCVLFGSLAFAQVYFPNLKPAATPAAATTVLA